MNARRHSLPRTGRWMNGFTSWTLAALVLGSVVLAVLLWRVAPPSTLSQVNEASYQAPDSVATTYASVVRPMSIMFLDPGSVVRSVNDYDQDAAAFGTAWDAVQSVLEELTPTDVTSGKSTTWDAFQAAVSEADAANQGAAAQGEGAIEVNFATALPWSVLWSLAPSHSAWSGKVDPLVTNLLIVPGETTQIWLGGPQTSVLEVSIALGAAGASLTDVLQETNGVGQPMVPFTSDLQGLPCYACYVPAQLPDLAPVSLAQGGEQLSPQDLAAALFPDPLQVQETTENGEVKYTDPDGKELVVNNGRVDFTALVPQTSSSSAESISKALLGVFNYVNEAGGWPPESLLSEMHASASGATFGFSTEYQGYLVLGAPPPIAVTMVGGTPTTYERQVPSPGPVIGTAQPLQTATNAFNFAVAQVQLGNFPGAPKETVQAVLGLYPAFFMSDTALEPVWVVEVVGTAAAGNGLALVDASGAADGNLVEFISES